MIAANLDQTYINLDPSRPLPGDSEFYVQRKNNPLDAMRKILLSDSLLPPKILFSGHRGSGKSTELSRLMVQPEIQGKYLIVHYSVSDVLDPAGLDYSDLLFSIGAQIFIQVTHAELKLGNRLLEELDRWRSAIESDFFLGGEETEAVLKLEAFFIKALSRLKMEYISREKMRRIIKQRLSEMIEIINLIIAEVESKIGKKVLVAIDDLDRPDPLVARELFYEHQTFLTLPNCSIIYTIPIALLYSQEFGQARQAFTNSYVLPSVTITKRSDRSPDQEGRALMKEFALKRMSPDLIAENALDHAISISGGVFREMARIIGMATSNAFARGEEKIHKEDVERAGNSLRNEFKMMLRNEDYDELREIYETRKLKASETCVKLLHNLSILEYQNDERWCDVHPVIVPLITGK